MGRRHPASCATWRPACLFVCKGATTASSEELAEQAPEALLPPAPQRTIAPSLEIERRTAAEVGVEGAPQRGRQRWIVDADHQFVVEFERPVVEVCGTDDRPACRRPSSPSRASSSARIRRWRRPWRGARRNRRDWPPSPARHRCGRRRSAGARARPATGPDRATSARSCRGRRTATGCRSIGVLTRSRAGTAASRCSRRPRSCSRRRCCVRPVLPGAARQARDRGAAPRRRPTRSSSRRTTPRGRARRGRARCTCVSRQWSGSCAVPRQ